MKFKIFKPLLLFIFFTFVMISCENTKRREPIAHSQKNTKELKLENDILTYKKIIDSQAVADTLIANSCNEAPSQKDVIDEILEKNNKSDQKSVKRIHQNNKKIPCKGQFLYIDQYQHVSLVVLNASDKFKVIGRSSHDSVPTGGDFILIKYGENKYAYNLGHICGSIQIEYAKNSININDILHSRIWDSAWHIVENKGRGNDAIQPNKRLPPAPHWI